MGGGFTRPVYVLAHWHKTKRGLIFAPDMGPNQDIIRTATRCDFCALAGAQIVAKGRRIAAVAESCRMIVSLSFKYAYRPGQEYAGACVRVSRGSPFFERDSNGGTRKNFGHTVVAMLSDDGTIVLLSPRITDFGQVMKSAHSSPSDAMTRLTKASGILPTHHRPTPSFSKAA